MIKCIMSDWSKDETKVILLHNKLMVFLTDSMGVDVKQLPC